MADPMDVQKIVHVRAYERVRLRRREHVRAHWRSPPVHQYELPF